MHVYLDDERPLPAGYDIKVTTAEAAIELIKSGVVKSISLDHDLGTEKTGYDVAKFIEEHAYNGGYKFHTLIHSMNPVGRENIRQALMNARRYWMNKRP